MSPIPWGTILKHGPSVLAAARSLLANQSGQANARHRSLEMRVEHLEKMSVETANLLQQMAEQLQALTLAQQDAQRRLRMALAVGIAAAALGAAALITALVLR